MELKKGYKIGLVIIGLLGLQSFVIWVSYNYGNNDGFREARIGYMKQPTSDGTITVGEKGKVTFTPAPTEPVYDSSGPWNSKSNREYVEHQHFNMGNTQYGKWVPTRVASATCSPMKSPNRWYCKYRELGESFNRYQIIEVNPKSGDWQGIPQ
jgi:hypothetical protein